MSDQDNALHQMDQEQQMHTMEEERDLRTNKKGSELFEFAASLGKLHQEAARIEQDAAAAILDQQPHRGYSLFTVREVVTHLAWESFTDGDLNELNSLAHRIHAAIRSRKAARRADEKEKQRLDMIAHPERYTPLQRDALTRETVYPKDAQGRSRYAGD